ncbi:HNH endonuclease [Streptomyces phage TomSawyer]|nr:HNH endonuclease [Streptomyces phage TomSawyer]
MPGVPKINSDSTGRYITSNGYVKIRRDDVIGPKKWVLEHRYVMEQKLGRELVKGENVHHKDGNRQNNHPDNLELWVTVKQPSGQRPEDLVEWAKEILRRYDN